MSSHPLNVFANHWTALALQINLVVFFSLAGALLLGLIVGYERSYHGRAAGMRTYGMVCMASAALTVLAGYPEQWFGAHATTMVAAADPTRIIQGIVTGIGFLGAGVIMKEGMNISGLTTAASIWASSAIGVLVGVGFYAAAILLALLSASLMMWGSKIEARLPTRPAVTIIMRFRPGFIATEDTLRRVATERGYIIANGSFSITYENTQVQWQFVAVAVEGRKSASLMELSNELLRFEGIDKFQISHARN
ncbi:MgtC/SapB family protein [Permianibacter sp. IMCC34836]|uniref:MgtC/SapB family protein n=1 Tax=Permianibacter fluminis TaxID=2738515 RepID=UPI001551A475|nr:MgtC/SapB family protein [Permianibacter fluminis]NQD36751.1 MgtC/SapB family protein [Permianibacter fluminis]